MHERPEDTPPLQLTDSQQTVIDFARRDLDTARADDLAAMDEAALILRVERLRSRLHAVLQVIDEVAPEQPQ